MGQFLTSVELLRFQVILLAYVAPKLWLMLKLILVNKVNIRSKYHQIIKFLL